MYKIEHVDMSPEATKKHEKKWGQFNDFPPNWRKLTEKEFAQSHFSSYTPEFVDFRQMMRFPFDSSSKDESYVVAHLYFMHDNCGYAMSADYWKGKVSYYKFGCEHDMVHISNDGRYLNTYKCSICGYVNQVDSSD